MLFGDSHIVHAAQPVGDDMIRISAEADTATAALELADTVLDRAIAKLTDER